MTIEMINKLKQFKVIPVIQINSVEQAIPLAKVLVENGLPVAEVTFRTEAAAEAIKAMREAYPEMCIGAGTVLNAEQIEQAQQAGAEFVVAPGLNPNTVRRCQEVGMPIVPGVNSPSQVEQALELGLNFLKFFPAEASGGVAMVKSLLAPYVDVSLMPTGGIGKGNVNDYLAIDRVVCCGGTWMVAPKLIENEQWEEIGQLVREAVAHVA
ncbi:bifunctional 4-hydroxy-2-oxoglutarate aldolase/2-dehydro-3-deoxy-phosphogluconate aldolase [Vibrio coralliilyticus]|jgi:2-dehydro-3-deoxyphosphogluconate aldolase/(4S)-4-hydroxy-2-oxoglutarate aldolase|uniref:bifunctional 4-hydroxy-2-oxoglutarate aldolase/2-dehydro-3-deoxy-phosphogluconate aldolase n=1 Tax=Vibrio TaxID=662 RepID=UPI000502FAC1|nr:MULTISPECIES: bifunctional 4-hydroxy-2-oxoglutarate aldolase/2-dehydro-3-deoxy-phosphogluconate aldolase [Vibrio]KFI13001.1 2-dehydro-3-deoxyphosphogluconate aldolase [Vibrio sp. B183]NOI17792.1 bifunctional 4-hydroxy-2-oxoglutarate aldolase/2-dehydro-3-deoxy-phosphogluconate aldolase [Vibrio coralliilyticus]NOI57178.1 bifunctional 4-hydroxy-2-oxoglutarate aldolase/2-dehydro-3-deoxy-phosphogluconate aldolase [Vibrio coralliilyticus]NOI74332.1 bifunctional 4-hydroxy-2-oxoglutarate aldolase/2-